MKKSVAGLFFIGFMVSVTAHAAGNAGVKQLNAHDDILKSLGDGLPGIYWALPVNMKAQYSKNSCELGGRESDYKAETGRIISESKNNLVARDLFNHDIGFFRYACAATVLNGLLKENYFGWPTLADPVLGEEPAEYTQMVYMKTAIQAVPFFERVAQKAQGTVFASDYAFRRFAADEALNYFADPQNFKNFQSYLYDVQNRHLGGNYARPETNELPAPVTFTWTTIDKQKFRIHGGRGLVIESGSKTLLGNGLINGRKYEISTLASEN